VVIRKTHKTEDKKRGLPQSLFAFELTPNLTKGTDHMGVVINFPASRLPSCRKLEERYFDLANWWVSEQGWPTIKIEHRWVALRRSRHGWTWETGPLTGYGRLNFEAMRSPKFYPDERTARWKAWNIVSRMIEGERDGHEPTTCPPHEGDGRWAT
jgi:hypothetical protein